MMRFFQILILFFLTLSYPVAAQSELEASFPGNEQETLERAINQAMEYSKLYMQATGGDKIYKGTPSIEKTGDYYTITLPATTYVHPFGLEAHVKPTTLNAKPGKAPHEWQMAMTVPFPIRVTNKGDEGGFIVDAEEQKTIYQWHDQSFIISNSNTYFGNVRILVEEESPEDPTKTVTTQFALIEKLQTQSYNTLPDHTEQTNVIKAALNSSELPSLPTNFLSRFKTSDINANVSGIHFYNNAFPLMINEEEVDYDEMVVDLVTLDLGTAVQIDDTVDVLQRASISGIDILGLEEDLPADYTLEDISVSMLFKDIPLSIEDDMAKLNTVLEDIREDNQANEGEAQPGTASLSTPETQKMPYADIKKKLSEAGAKIAMQLGFNFQENYGLTIRGQATGNTENPYGFDGVVELALRNFNAIKDLVSSADVSEAAPEAEAIQQQANMFLPIIQGLGKKSKDPSGVETVSYRFEINGPNDITMNGQNINVLMPMLMGAAMSQGMSSGAISTKDMDITITEPQNIEKPRAIPPATTGQPSR